MQAAACTQEAALEAASEYLAARPDAVLGTMPLGTTMPLRDAALLFRHGGGTLHGWRLTRAFDSLEYGKERWSSLSGAVRQGALALIYRGSIQLFTSAPRLRSRW